MDSHISIIKAIHQGLYEGIRGKKLKLNKMQKLMLESSKRINIIPKRSGLI
jgi:hypothetical protein